MNITTSDFTGFLLFASPQGDCRVALANRLNFGLPTSCFLLPASCISSSTSDFTGFLLFASPQGDCRAALANRSTFRLPTSVFRLLTSVFLLPASYPHSANMTAL